MTFKTCGDFQTDALCAAPMCNWHTKPVDTTQDGHCVSEIAVGVASTGTSTTGATDECNNIRDA